jgi:transposase
MIVIGVDVHKHSLSAVAVDEVGRQLDCLETSDGEELVAWSKRVGRRRLWALEDCRHVTRGLERTLQRGRQRLVRVPPRLTAPERRRGRVRGKSDLIDALAIARAALREPLLDSPRPEEARLRELKLLVDHRDDLVDERRRAGPARRSRPRRLARPPGRPARPPRANNPGADRARTPRSLPQPHSLDPRARPRAAGTNDSHRAAPARAARLRWHHRREAALRDRANRPLQI